MGDRCWIPDSCNLPFPAGRIRLCQPTFLPAMTSRCSSVGKTTAQGSSTITSRADAGRTGHQSAPPIRRLEGRPYCRYARLGCRCPLVPANAAAGSSLTNFSRSYANNSRRPRNVRRQRDRIHPLQPIHALPPRPLEYRRTAVRCHRLLSRQPAPPRHHHRQTGPGWRVYPKLPLRCSSAQSEYVLGPHSMTSPCSEVRIRPCGQAQKLR